MAVAAKQRASRRRASALNVICSFGLLIVFNFPWPLLAVETDVSSSSPFDEKTALEFSQAAIGQSVADYPLQTTDGETIRLSDFSGKPLVVSFIYTSCFHICPTTTQHLAKVVKKAQHVLGDDGFSVLTIGFDVANDTPEAMRVFAAQQSIDDPQWHFLSAHDATIEKLSQDLGFLYYASANGFDHLIQATIVDAKGKVYRQVYDVNFATPHLVEPLKALIYDKPLETSVLSHIGNKIRLFCTVYDAANDRYRLDYSMFIGFIIGLSTLGIVLYIVIREWRRNRAKVS